MTDLQSMTDYLFHMTAERMRRRILRDVRETYPNFDVMPYSVQLECVSDSLTTGLERMVRDSAAMRAHEEAYAA